MKAFTSFFGLALLTMTSCATSTSFDNDDVYSVRASDVPFGESLSDETSYASFKSRKEGRTNDQLSYADDVSVLERERCLESRFYCNTCGCSFQEWSNYQTMARRGLANGSRFISFYSGNGLYHYGVVPMHYTSFGYSPYSSSAIGFYPTYLHNSYYQTYGYDSYYNNGMANYWYNGFNPYGQFYHGQPYYGSGLGGYGYGGNSNGWSNSAHQTSTTIRGPRGTNSSGTYNPNGRTSNPNMVKSGTMTPRTPVKTSGAAASRTQPNSTVNQASRANNSSIERRDVSGRVYTPSGSVSTNVNRNTGVPSNQSREASPAGRVSTGTPAGGSSRTNVEYRGSYPSRNTSVPSTPQRSESGTVRSNPSYSPQRSSSPSQGSMSSPSRSSSPSQGTGGGGRSGGSSGVSSGRR